MTFRKQVSLLAVMACLGLVLAGCQPSDPDSPDVKDLTSIAVTPNPVNMEIGGVASLTVTGTLKDKSTYVVNSGTTFASSAPSIATVDAATGYVKAIAGGNATITATHTGSGLKATTTVAVSSLRVLSIVVSPASSTLAPGATQALTVTATYNNLTTGTETSRSTFASSNAAVAVVDAAGIVTAIGAGTAQITATHTASGKTASAAITVSASGGGGGFVDITFDAAGITYVLTGFGGAEDATLAPDPAGGSNVVARVVKSATAELWAGTTVSTGANNSVGKIPFTATSTRMTVRVYSPRAGIPVRLKVEDAADGARSVETEALTTKVNTWETLTFDFAKQVAGTAPLNLAYTYDKLSIFFDFGKTGAAGGGGTFRFDDVAFATGGASGNTGTCTGACIDFASASVKYEPFEGLVSAAQSNDPVDATNKVAQFTKGPSGQPWAGATVYTVDATKSVPAFDLSGSKIVTLRVYSPVAGMNVRLKLEDAANSAIYLEKDALTTKVNEWETLSFDFATPVNGVYNAANTYDRVSLFPAFSTTAPPASNVTVYFDELAYTAKTGGGGATAPVNAPATVIPAGSLTIYSDAASRAGLDPFPDWGQNPPVTRSEVTIAGNKSLKYVWAGPGGLYQGIDWSSNAADVSGKSTLHIDFWTPDLTSVKVSIISSGKENAYTQALTKGGWNSVDIDLSNYTVPDKAAIIQIKLEPNGPGTLYVDNIYFWGTAGGGSGSCGTTEPTCAPTTVVPSGAVTIYSDAASVAGLDPFPNWGQNPPVTSSEPTIAGNKSLKYVWAGPGGLYQGIDWASNPVNVSAKGKLHIDFWTADLSAVKVSIISPGLENAYTQTLTTGGWNSVDIDLSNYTVPNLTNIIQIKLEPTTPGTLYVDNIYFWGTGSGSSACTGGTFTGGVFAADYRGSLNPADGKPPLTTLCGDIGFFYDSRLPATALYDFGGISNQVVNPGGINNFYYGLGLKLPAITDGYFGAYVNAPANGIANVSSFTNLRFTLWGPAELFEKSFTPQIQVVMAGPSVSGCGSNSGRSEVQAPLVNALKIGAASNYVVPLSSFTLKFACSGETTAAEVLAKVAQVNFTLIGTNIQYSVPDTSTPPAYSNGLNVGPISFN
jgi:hypothetical protein